MSALHFKLNSGRVLLLEEGLTPEEEEEARSPLGMAILEGIANQIEKNTLSEVKEGDPRYEELKQHHGL